MILVRLPLLEITSFGIFLSTTLIVLLIFFFSGTKSSGLVPTTVTYLNESIFVFVFNILVEQSGPKAAHYIPIIFSVFTFILCSNFIGLLPYTLTSTAQVALTFFLSFGFFISFFIIGINTLGTKFFNLFVPKVPGWLLPFMIVIEFISWIIRPISLAVRLFANMLAGHILLFIVGGGVLSLSKIMLVLGLVPFTFLVCFYFLEIFIAFLQAYVFTILLTIYLADSYHEHS